MPKISTYATDSPTADALRALASAFRGVRVNITTNQAGLNLASRTAITWQAKGADPDGIVDLDAQPTRMTIPAGLGGKYAIFTATLDLSDTPTGTIRLARGGVELVDYTAGFASGAIGRPIGQLVTDPILLTAGEYYQLLAQGDASCTIVNSTWWNMRLL